MASKLRTNIILIVLVVAGLTAWFANMLAVNLVAPANEIFALLVGIGIGGLLALAGQMATDPPAAAVPVETVHIMMREMREMFETMHPD